MKARLTILAAAIVIASAVPVVAHHSFAAEFDAAKTVDFTGVVTKVEWMNPHVYFYVDVKDPQTGKVANWGCEMGSPNGLTRQGWNRNTLRIGMMIRVEGSAAKDGSNVANARSASPTGRSLRRRAQPQEKRAASRVESALHQYVP